MTIEDIFPILAPLFRFFSGEATAHIPMKHSAAGVMETVWRGLGKNHNP